MSGDFICIPPLFQRLAKRWRTLLNRCKVRIDCHSDVGDYSEIVHDLTRVIKEIKPAKMKTEDKIFVAKTLKTNLNSIFTLVQSHYMNGNSGVAAVLYNELSGLAGSSMIRRVSKVLRDSAGKSRGGRGGGVVGRSDQVPASQGVPQLNPRRGAPGGRGGYNHYRYNYNNRPRGGNFPRPPMRCYTCQVEGHRFQDCPQNRPQNFQPPQHGP